MSARVDGLAGLPVLNFDATGRELAGVSLSKTSTTKQARPGDVVTYTLMVTHASGPSNAAAVGILDELPDGLDVAGATWLCAGSGGALCAAASGSGDVDVGASIPVAASVTVTVTASVVADAAFGSLVNTALAELTSSVDPDTSNNQDGHAITIVPLTDAIFEDGFEGDDVPVARKSASAVSAIVPAVPSSVASRPWTAAELLDAAGVVLARVEVLDVDGQRWFRQRTAVGDAVERVGAWTAFVGGIPLRDAGGKGIDVEGVDRLRLRNAHAQE